MTVDTTNSGADEMTSILLAIAAIAMFAAFTLEARKLARLCDAIRNS
jgi:hypothetical protein